MKYGAWCVALLVAGMAVAQDDIVTRKVIGTEFPGGEYKHPACIEELANGDLYLSYYGGDGEYEANSKVWGMRLPQGTQAWTTPEVIADTPFRSEGNPVIFQAPDGKVWLFYVQRYGDTWSESRIKGKVSEDGAQTWSDSFMVTFEQGTMVRGRPILLMNGNYLLPVYHETGHDREIVGPDTTSFFIHYNPETNEWTESNRITSKFGNLQAAPVQIDENHLIMYARRGGGYGDFPDGRIVRSVSHDGGYTWSEGEETDFPNPNAAVDFIKLQNGHLMLVYNDSLSDRTPLTVAISTNNDQTYPYRRNIGEGENTFAYPMALQTRDGTIHVIYTTDGRKTIMHCTFDETAILSHRVAGR